MLSSACTKPPSAVLKARVLKAALFFATTHISIGMNIVELVEKWRTNSVLIVGSIKEGRAHY